ncbi:hypothetical protein PC9H_008502 [Pleurotus ostreatus]|uniref:RRM domain-containing protein n=1 Tax=Pleurotus ostreatus TaxID=5322 RepID=A0A8H7DT58_PLEOS|nr:uncharacterized protein PC9H_008502 [Pleurotus ostreatus]KAF7426136.1 hypothetical protein PC9H_008502 [Pleurotus ostreatus]
MQQNRPAHARLNNFHGQKKQLLGRKAGNAPPAWRGTAPVPTFPGAAKGKQVAQNGSRIFISNLPLDVVEQEVEDLFKKTVGPLKEVVLVYNNQGKSKGLAIVSFQKTTDAAVARTKYHGKIVDGRRPIKVEIIADSDSQPSPSTPTAPSLFSRLAPPPPNSTISTTLGSRVGPQVKAPAAPLSNKVPPTAPGLGTVPARRRVKKGPRRLNKRPAAAKSKEDLDKEMDDYQASS